MTGRGRSGFAVVAVLILVGLIGLLGTTYARHVSLANRSSSASPAAMRAGGAVDSGLQLARQLLRTRGPAASASIAAGSTTAVLEVSDLGGDHGRLRLRSVDSRGLGSTLLFEVVRTPLILAGAPDELPRIRPEVVAALLADPSVPKTWVGGLTTIQDADLEGLVIVEDGAVLTLSGVCLHGCILSERTALGLPFGPYDVTSAPALQLSGDLRVRPRPELAGIALVLPDGSVRTTVPNVRVQFDGDVVAHTLVLAATGSLRGNAAAVDGPSIAAAIQRPRHGRGPRPWAAQLELGEASDVLSLAAVPRFQALADLPGIVGFTFDDP